MVATFRKRGKHWQVQVRRKGYAPVTRTFVKRAMADQWAQEIESTMGAGVFVSRREAEGTTLLTAIERYREEVSKLKRGYAQESSVLDMWLDTPIAQRPLAAITSSDVANLKSQWVNEKYAPATIVRRLSVLSDLFTICRTEWKMGSLLNPVADVAKPTISNARSRRIKTKPSSDDEESSRLVGPDELKRIGAATRSALLPVVLLLAVETAMRRSEIVAMRWELIDFGKRFAHLPKTKNGDPRDVPLSPAAVGALQAMKRTKNGRVIPVRADAITRAFARALARARVLYERECKADGKEVDPTFLVDLSFHDLRHEATTRLSEIYGLMELTRVTGHKDTRMLMRYYHPRPEDLAARLWATAH